MRLRNAVDWKFYDKFNESHSSDRDPRPLEKLEDVINPGFDEHGTMLSHPLPPHIPRLSQEDRRIYETCSVSGSKVLWPHFDTTGVRRHLTVQYIKAKAKCTPKEAGYIADSCVALEATKKMVDTFCEGAQKNGAKRVIEYLWKFVIGVTEAEAPSDEREPWEDEPVEAGELQGGLSGECGLCEDVPVEEIKLPVKEGPWATMVNGELTWVADIQALTVKEVPEIPEEEPIVPVGIISYHVLEDFGTEEPDWFGIQPDWFKDKFESIQSCESLEELSKLGQDQHAGNGFSRDQAGVFWTEYNSRKHALEPTHLSISARSILRRLVQANGNLGWVGQWLYKIGEGEIKISPQPTKYEMGIIWQTYKRRKENHEVA